jgi:hypothetical protein
MLLHLPKELTSHALFLLQSIRIFAPSVHGGRQFSTNTFTCQRCPYIGLAWQVENTCCALQNKASGNVWLYIGFTQAKHARAALCLSKHLQITRPGYKINTINTLIISLYNSGRHTKSLFNQENSVYFFTYQTMRGIRVFFSGPQGLVTPAQLMWVYLLRWGRLTVVLKLA